eukprot:5462856-Pleurochrysis_carterae.AAC.1
MIPLLFQRAACVCYSKKYHLTASTPVCPNVRARAHNRHDRAERHGRYPVIPAKRLAEPHSTLTAPYIARTNAKHARKPTAPVSMKKE